MRKRTVRGFALVALCSIAVPGGAWAASDRFVPAFSFWSGAPIAEEKSGMAPNTPVSPPQASIPSIRRTPTQVAAIATPSDTPVVRLLPANSSAVAGTSSSAVTRANPSGAERDPLPKDETERWVPAFAFTSGAIIQDASGSLNPGSVTECLGPQSADGLLPPFWVPFGQDDCKQRPLQPPAASNARLVAPYMGISLELSTPGLSFLPTRPRLFAHVDARVDFAFDKSVARYLAPGDIYEEMVVPNNIYPYNDPRYQQPGYPSRAFRGTGAKLGAEVLSWIYSGGIGGAFTLEVLERRLRIKPSVEYMYQTVEAKGELAEPVQAYSGTRPYGGAARTPSRFFFTQLKGKKTQSFHMLGPGLEFEMDTVRWGPVVLSLFVGGKAYANLSEREIKFTATEEVENPDSDPFPTTTLPPDFFFPRRLPSCTGISAPDGCQAQLATYPENGHTAQTVSTDFSLVMPEWNYDINLGMRFRWLPLIGGGR